MTDLATLQAAQAPLKQRYVEDPASAVITLHASGDLDSADVACSVQTGQALVAAGLHPATGGTGALACSGDMLLQALVACAGVTLRAVAINRGIVISGTVRAEGELDFRGTLGVDRDAKVGFGKVRLIFDVESDADAETLDKVIATTRRYCVVLQTLVDSPELDVVLSRR